MQDQKNTIYTIKHGGGNTMFVFCVKGTRLLHCIEGPINKAMYVKILTENLISSASTMKMGCGWALRNDNDPRHIARAAKEDIKIMG